MLLKVLVCVVSLYNKLYYSITFLLHKWCLSNVYVVVLKITRFFLTVRYFLLLYNTVVFKLHKKLEGVEVMFFAMDMVTDKCHVYAVLLNGSPEQLCMVSLTCRMFSLNWILFTVFHWIFFAILLSVYFICRLVNVGVDIMTTYTLLGHITKGLWNVNKLFYTQYWNSFTLHVCVCVCMCISHVSNMILRHILPLCIFKVWA
jgi:hypothetical protein